MLKLGIVCDLKEEHWPSMDLVGDMLVEEFTNTYSNSLEAVRVQPPLRRACSVLPFARRSKLAWNADRLLNRTVLYPFWLRTQAHKLDLFHIVDHSYAQLAWQTVPQRTIVTCHDLDAFACLLDRPEEKHRPAWFRAYTRHVLSGLQRAAHVVCVSDTVKSAVITSGLIPADKVSTVYNGVHPACSPKAHASADQQVAKLLPFAPGVPLLLHVGSTVRRKRIDVLLEIFARVRQHIPEAKLVRVGGPLSAEQSGLAERLRVREHVLELPFLDREVLAALYRRCAVTLLTSDAEGFGLPVIEAMACGCPVIATGLPVLREVGGPAGTYIRKGDLNGWVEATVQQIHEHMSCSDAASVRRVRCIDNARRFSWTDSARQLYGIYSRIANQ